MGSDASFFLIGDFEFSPENRIYILKGIKNENIRKKQLRV